MDVEDLAKKPHPSAAQHDSSVKEEDSDSERQAPVVEFYKPALRDNIDSEESVIAKEKERKKDP